MGPRPMQKVAGLLILALLLALPGLVSAQEPTGETPQLEILNYQWIHNDIIRNIEEIRRAKDPAERRDLVEDIEQIIYDKIEFPLMYKQSEMTVEGDLSTKGAAWGVEDIGEAAPEAPEIAQAYALLGIAKGFEGFGAAASDMFEKARDIYSGVMSMTVSLDHNEDNRTLNSWISASRGFWGNSAATRVTFFGKRVAQAVVDGINSDNVTIVRRGKNPTYTEYVAKRDFVRGLQRYIQTDDTLKERKPNKFFIYLEPGDYELKSQVSSEMTVLFSVSRSVNRNGYIIETIGDGVTITPIPDISAFEEEMKKLLMQQNQTEDPLAPGGDDLGLGLDDNLLDSPPAPEPPLE